MKKKVSWQTSLGVVCVEEQCFLRRGQRYRPFLQQNHLKNHKYSRRLSRIVVDFCSESPFAQAVARVNEHYGIQVAASSARTITNEAARKAKSILRDPFTEGSGMTHQSSWLVAEIDGGMVPVMEPCKDEIDRRKGKKLQWRELRVGVQQMLGEASWKYSVAYSIDDLELQMRNARQRMGVKGEIQIHGVGDGAPWIKESMCRIYGEKAKYLIDFFHMSEYLFKAAEICEGGCREMWYNNARHAMRIGKMEEVVQELEAAHRLEPHEGVESCLRYFKNRPGQFEYKEALSNGLPIGSGKVESSHRSLIQSRLKLSGAWWREENAENIACLRAVRANGMWSSLWQSSSNPSYCQHRKYNF